MGKYCKETIEELIANEVQSLGFDFIKLELDHNILRVVADCAGGITIDHCSTINYHLNKVLSVTPNLQLNYTLEVSSPGIQVNYNE